MADPPSPSSKPVGGRARKDRTFLWFGLGMGGAIGLLGGAYALFFSDAARHHSIEVRWPENAPRGEPIHVGYGVKAGDVFVTVVESKAQFVLSVEEKVQTSVGMNLKVHFTLGHEVLAKEGGGLRSQVRVLLERADSTVEEAQAAIWLALKDRKNPLTFAFDRLPDGRPDRSTVPPEARASARRRIFDRTVAGLGDLASNWLPAGDVRLGESWDLAEVADDPGIPDVVHTICNTLEGHGFPPSTLKGRVGAEAVEKVDDGEEALRLRVVIVYEQQGEVGPPSAAGHVTTAATIEGNVWVALATGIVWRVDLQQRLLSSYLGIQFPAERKGEGRLTWRTSRADAPPR